MSDTLTILRHPLSVMAKTWNTDGTISGYGDAKYFRRNEVQVNGLQELSDVLSEIESQATSVVIRGKYVGDRLARDRDGSEFQPGKVRRALDYFDDQPMYSLMLDIDGFEPLVWDPLTHPVEAVDEYLVSELPQAFWGAGYHWQLSNSHGHASKAGALNAHAWFWSREAYTSAQLKSWATLEGIKTDKTLFNPVQAHYTASPVFEDGVVDPLLALGIDRSGFVEGLLGDELDLDIGAAARVAVSGSGGRAQRLMELAERDPIAQVLRERGLVRSQARDGSLNVTCPFADEHGSGGAGAETSTQYFLPNTNGHAEGHFKCLHDGCVSRKRSDFIARLGIDENALGGEHFEPVRDEDGVGEGAEAADGAAGSGVGGGGVGVGRAGGMDRAQAAMGRARAIPIAKHLCTDLANANRVMKYFGKKLMVISGDWYTWSGKQWRRESSDAYRNTCLLSKLLSAEEATWRVKPVANDEERAQNLAIADALKKWGVRSEGKPAIDAAIGLLRQMMTVDASEVDRDPWLLNCANGTVDLRTGVMKPHDPNDRITKLIEIDYDPSAKSEYWDAMLSRITQEDGMGATKPVAAFLRRWFGYCATGSVRENKFVIFWGQGSNGKSTLLDTVAGVLGEYATTAAPGLVMASKGNNHPTEIASLFGRRMVTTHETGEGGVLKEDFVKQATGGDVMTARYMRQDFFSFTPTHKLQMVTNYKPTIKGSDHGIWRRVLLVAFGARFGDALEIASGKAHYLKDTRTAEYLQSEKSAILTWIVQGAKDWFEHGLQEPDSVVAQSRDYQGEQDRVLKFVEECCQLNKEAKVPLTGNFGIFEAYREWCRDANYMALAKTRFQAELERIVPWFKVIEGPRAKADRRRVYFCSGLSLLED